MAQNHNDFKSALRFTIPLILLSVVISIAAWQTGYENKLAIALYNQEDNFSWMLREYSTWPVLFITLLALIYSIVPKLRNKSETLRTMSATWIVTLAIGAGLICSVMTKEFVERPRPKATIVAETPIEPTIALKGNEAEISGKAFVSGHTATAAMLAVPFFALWTHRRRKPALIILAAGTAYTGLIAYSRMTLGAHFLTDNIWAFTLVMATAALVAPLFQKKGLSNKILIPALMVAGLCMVLFNDFTTQISISPKVERYDLTFTCKKFNILADEEESYFKANITGSGAPIRNVKFVEDIFDVSISTMPGLFRNISCDSANVRLKRGERIRIPRIEGNEMKISLGRYTQIDRNQHWLVFFVDPSVGEIDHTPIGYVPPSDGSE